MIFRVAILLVGLAIGLLITGLITRSSTVYAAAAAASALAIVLLWRYMNSQDDEVFVTHEPPQVQPDWDRPLRQASAPASSLSAPVPEVAIPDYEDLVASEILPSLETLSVEQLQAVIKRERMGLERDRIIRRAEDLIDLTRGPDVDVREEMAEAVKTTPTRRRATSRRTNKAQAVDPASLAAQRKSNREAPTDPDLSI